MSGPGRSPWWSSGADDLDPTADPFEAHRAARSGTEGPATAGAEDPDPSSGAEDPDPSSGAEDPDPSSGAEDPDDRPWDVPWEDWDERDPSPPEGAQRSTVDDAFEAVQALARFVAARRGGRSGIRPHPRDQTCRACPWCIAMRSLGDVRPEVVDHLDEALRHVVAAARAWVDAAESRGAWEHIELDDDDGPAGG